MATEELIQAFPECEKIKREDIAECITKAMTEERFYAEASDKVYRKAHELWPYQRGLKDDDPERVAYEAYFWANFLEGVEPPFKGWLKTFETEFIAQHGQVRTFDEACQTAADEWVRMIFGNHVQNNGDKSDAGGLAMVLGTLVKDKAGSGYTLKWRDHESGKPVDIVSLDRDKTKDLGDMIWGDIKTAMDAEGCNTIKMEIEYEPIALSKSDQVLRLIENVISHPQNFVSGDQSVAEGMIERITKIIETKITQ